MVHHGLVVESLVEELVTAMRASVQGELSGRTQIVDNLLDLRLACRENPVTLAVIDRLLGELPGRTTVPNAWWLEALVDIERTHRSGSVSAAQAAVVTAPVGGSPVAPPLPRRRRTQS